MYSSMCVLLLLLLSAAVLLLSTAVLLLWYLDTFPHTAVPAALMQEQL
jgi:hypothetical protein